MGEVYRAEDTKLEREVAIKVLPANLSDDRHYRERLEREAKTISRLQHPNVCTLYDFDSVDGTNFLVMEYLTGETLEQRLRSGPLPIEELRRVGREVAEAIAAAHEKGLVHRDLKPGNVMLSASGAKVLDFGLAKETADPLIAVETQAPTAAAPLTSEGSLLGTMPYMAPEQLEGRAADARTDIWALGCILYEMATGERPFRGDTQASLITSIMGSEPEPPSRRSTLTPESLDRVVHRCLRKDPRGRWHSARDVGIELADLEVSSDRGRTVPPARRPVRPYAWLAAVTVAIVLAGVWWFVTSKRSEPADKPRQGPRPPGIAVLPFDNVGGDAAVEPLALGVAVELTGRLSEYQAYGQAGPVDQATASRYRDQEVCQAADGMQVRLVYDGSVQRAGDRVRVTAELIGCPERERLWGDQFDRDLTDLLSLQEEIARQIFIATERVLRFDQRFAETQTARYHFNQRTPRDNDRALSMLRDQIAQGTSDSEVYDTLANVLAQRILAGWDDSPDARVAELDRLVGDCFEHGIAPELCGIWGGFTAQFTGESKRLVRAFEQAVADLGDTYPAVHGFLGMAYAHTGRSDEALASLDRAFEMSPQDRARPAWYRDRGIAYASAGRYEEARDAVLAGLDLGINDYNNIRAGLYQSLAAYQAMLGDHEAAAEAWQDSLRLGGPSDWATIVRPLSNVSEERRNRYRNALRIAGLED